MSLPHRSALSSRRALRGAVLALATMAASIAMPGRADAAPAATIAPSAALDGLVWVGFDAPVRHVDTQNVVLRVAGTGTNLGTSVACLNASGSSVSCWSGPVTRVRMRHTAPLIAGQQYVVTVNPSSAPSAVTDMIGVAVALTAKSFRASLVEEEDSPGARQRWAEFAASKAYDRSIAAERIAGARATLTFTGTSVTWYTRRGPNQGVAAVYLDGARRADVNNYASTMTYRIPRSITGLSNRLHRLTVVVTGRKGSSRATGAFVSIDAWGVNGSRLSSPSATYLWDAVSDERAAADRYARANLIGARTTFTFRGKGIDWYTLTGPSQGKAEVLIDGVRRMTVDNYSSTTRRMVRRPIAGLSDAVHTITVRALGTRNASSSGTMVVVDRFVVRLPATSMFRGLGTWVDRYDYGLDPSSAAASMKSKGVQTLYLQTARYNSDSAFVFEDEVGQWIEAAHANGMKIVGWYLPAYGRYLDQDVDRTVAIATFRSPAGQRFDALAIDIEFKGEVSGAPFNEGITTHIQRVRSRVGNAYTIGAIVPAPLGMAISPQNWTGFPWAALGRYADVVLPMAYWSYRTDCASKPQHCPYLYTRQNVAQARAKTGLLVHVIGGIADDVTTAEVADFVRGAKDERAYGGSMYDYRTTTRSSYWTELKKLAW